MTTAGNFSQLTQPATQDQAPRQRPRGTFREGPRPSEGSLRVGLGRLQVRFTRGGGALPWLGPAFRGIIAATLKRQSCRFDLAEQNGRRRYCAGCPSMPDCGYGLLYEPDPMGIPSPARGADQAPSGVVLSPSFPCPKRCLVGDRLHLDVVLAGAAARPPYADGLATAIAAAGGDAGLGPDHLQFEIAETGAFDWYVLTPDVFPNQVDAAPGGYPRVRVELGTPLFLRSDPGENGRRRANRSPAFLDLFRPALRLVRRQFAQAGVALDADWSGLCQLAANVQTLDAQYESFRQRRWSSRTEHRAELEGVVGQAWFANVPAVLLPWLYWGGRLHIGGQRVAGAGRFHVCLE